jgi:hypothetical protein
MWARDWVIHPTVRREPAASGRSDAVTARIAREEDTVGAPTEVAGDATGGIAAAAGGGGIAAAAAGGGMVAGKGVGATGSATIGTAPGTTVRGPEDSGTTVRGPEASGTTVCGPECARPAAVGGAAGTGSGSGGAGMLAMSGSSDAGAITRDSARWGPVGARRLARGLGDRSRTSGLGPVVCRGRVFCAGAGGRLTIVERPGGEVGRGGRGAGPTSVISPELRVGPVTGGAATGGGGRMADGAATRGAGRGVARGGGPDFVFSGLTTLSTSAIGSRQSMSI